MKLKFLTVLAVAGMAIAGCSSSKTGNGTMDSSAVDTTKTASPAVVDTTKAAPDTTKQVPDTTRKQ